MKIDGHKLSLADRNLQAVTHTREIFIANLHRTSVRLAENIMDAGRQWQFKNNLPDLLFFLAHPETISVGLKDRHQAQPKDLLVPVETLGGQGIEFVRSIRGGGITYHWPGQVVCYPLMVLGKQERDIPAYMNKLEQVGIETLRSFGLDVHRRRDSAAHIGLWLNGRKIVSMGVKISNWVTSFGLAINLEGDISHSSYLRPCGIEGARLTTVEEALGSAPSREEVIDRATQSFASVFRRTPSRMPVNVIEEIRSAVK